MTDNDERTLPHMSQTERNKAALRKVQEQLAAIKGPPPLKDPEPEPEPEGDDDGAT